VTVPWRLVTALGTGLRLVRDDVALYPPDPTSSTRMPGSIPACSSITAWTWAADITLSARPSGARLATTMPCAAHAACRSRGQGSGAGGGSTSIARAPAGMRWVMLAVQAFGSVRCGVGSHRSGQSAGEHVNSPWAAPAAAIAVDGHYFVLLWNGLTEYLRALPMAALAAAAAFFVQL
jgi:hypothetical protein